MSSIASTRFARLYKSRRCLFVLIVFSDQPAMIGCIILTTFSLVSISLANTPMLTLAPSGNPSTSSSFLGWVFWPKRFLNSPLVPTIVGVRRYMLVCCLSGKNKREKIWGYKLLQVISFGAKLTHYLLKFELFSNLSLQSIFKYLSTFVS